jgi:hypothetical protein
LGVAEPMTGAPHAARNERLEKSLVIALCPFLGEQFDSKVKALLGGRRLSV